MYDVESIWRGIKARCGGHGGNSYTSCEICDKWNKSFDSFSDWFFENIYVCRDERLEIDKDLFSNGRKIYSPETCCFLPKRINVALAYKKEKSNGLPCGVSMASNGKFVAMIHRGSGHLCKTFNTAEAASEFYKINKERNIRELALFYKNYLPDRIFETLMNYECKQ